MADLKLSDLKIAIPQDGTYGLIDNLRGDLLGMMRCIQCGNDIPIEIAQAIELQMLKVLDLVSPEIRRTIAKFERYKATPKIGEN